MAGIRGKNLDSCFFSGGIFVKKDDIIEAEYEEIVVDERKERAKRIWKDVCYIVGPHIRDIILRGYTLRNRFIQTLLDIARGRI